MCGAVTTRANTVIIFFRLATQSPFIPQQNVVYFITSPFLVHQILTFYVNGVLKSKFLATGSKG
jgi:hypothetical protein